jgi:hypothetical protein
MVPHRESISLLVTDKSLGIAAVSLDWYDQSIRETILNLMKCENEPSYESLYSTVL